jgi:hypothetical protein
MHTVTSASTGSVATAAIFRPAIARTATRVRMGDGPLCQAPDLRRIMEMSSDKAFVLAGTSTSAAGISYALARLERFLQ